MNAKNLPLKFGFVGLLVVLSIWTVASNGLRQGIDLRGGHSLTFEFKVEKGDPGNISEQMLSTLKRRIDPDGLRSLEWRPIGDNRIEIRMPAASEESQRAEDAYELVLDRLAQRNISESDLDRIAFASDQELPSRVNDLLQRLAGDDEQLRATLREQLVAQLQDVREAFEARNQKLQAWRQNTENDDLYAAYRRADQEYGRLRKEILEWNIDRAELQGVLQNYLTQDEAQTLLKRGEEGEQEVRRRREAYQAGIERLKREHPRRAEEIARIRRLFETWAETRQFLDDPADLKRLVAQSGVLEFRIAPYSPTVGHPFNLSFEEAERYRQILQETNPEELADLNDELLWFPVARDAEASRFNDLITGRRAGRTYVLLYNTPENTMLREPGEDSWSLQKASPTVDQMNQPAVQFTFDARGANRFSRLTSLHMPDDDETRGHALAVLLDGEIYSAPAIRSVIGRQGIIEGDFTPEQVHELVSILNSGTLPARLNPDPVAENSFGPGLGAANREKGIRAGIIGLALVAAFMLVYYLLAGLIADMALVLNIILVLGAMSLLNAVFTLPGIAGLILTIGIAVDANVLIFERLREEQQKGQSVRMAVKNAYGRAFSAIFDANLTTLITCLILGWVGTEEVRGFAITLGLGIIFSMFTALVVSRWVFQALLETGVIKEPVPMLRLMGVPKVGWMAKRKLFWVISVVVFALGIVSLGIERGDIWGIEFSSGTQAVIEFEDGQLIDGQLPNDGLVEQRVRSAARQLHQEEDADYSKLDSTAQVETRLDERKVQDFLGRYDADGNGRVTAEEWQSQRPAGADEGYFEALVARIDDNGDGVLASEELQDLPEQSYQLSTTETSLPKIRKAIRRALGDSLVTRVARDFSLVTGADLADEDRELLTTLGIRGRLAVDGRTEITETLRQNAAAAYQDELRNFQGGVMFIVKNVEPTITEQELSERIQDLRLMQDFAAQQTHRSKVIGLRPSGDGYSALAVLSEPSSVTEEVGFFAGFAQGEERLLTAALQREEAIPATNFDPAIAAESAQRAIFAMVVSCLAIVGYLWFRFGSVRWGLAAVVCLVHDVSIVVGLVAASAWLSESFVGEILGINAFKIDLAMVAAILTVIGYSVNDTIVVFDRIRENRGKLATVSESVIDNSINQTLSRTILTSGTTFLVVLTMYVAGGPGIHAFSYALLVGIIFGTYSSIAVASPLLLGFRHAVVAKVAPATGQ